MPASGATLAAADEAWACDLVVKVKEPLENEYRQLRGQLIFTYFHLAGAPHALTNALLATRTTAIAYETVEDERGSLPLLAPMSGIAGAMAPLVGAHYLARNNGGRGAATRYRARQIARPRCHRRRRRRGPSRLRYGTLLGARAW